MNTTYDDAAAAVLRKLRDRGGFDDWWGCLDEDLRKEIAREIADAMQEVSNT